MPPVAGEQDANITVETATGYVNVAFVLLGIVRFPHCQIPIAIYRPVSELSMRISKPVFVILLL